MKITELLENDKNRLLTEISASGTAEKAVGILEKEVDRLLLTHNDAASSDAERNSAAHMMQAVRLALPFIDSMGKAKVYEKETATAPTSRKKTVAAVLVLIAGLVLIGYGLVPMVLSIIGSADASSRNDLITRAVAVIMGAAALFLSGSLDSKPSGAGSKDYHVEQRVDAERIYRNFRTIMISVDQSLEEVRLQERQDRKEQAGKIEGREPASSEIDLFSDLLAASYSGDPEFALEKIAGIKYYLHQQQIEAVDYSDETADFFDLMPGASGGTIRPALVADGRLLKKGLASKGS